MEMTLSKKTILYFLVFLWIVFSVVYIAWDIWSDFKNVQILNAYEQGRINTINVLITEAEKCEPVTVTGVEKQISIIGTHCLEEEVSVEK
jgi:hypothetical protein